MVAAHLRAVGKDDGELDREEYCWSWIFRKIYLAMIDDTQSALKFATSAEMQRPLRAVLQRSALRRVG